MKVKNFFVAIFKKIVDFFYVSTEIRYSVEEIAERMKPVSIEGMREILPTDFAIKVGNILQK